MTNYPRQNQKIFCENNPTDIGTPGSLNNGNPTIVNPPTVENIQSLSNYGQGYSAILKSGDHLPSVQEANGIQNATDKQLYYLFQKGIPEWHIETLYYIGDIARHTASSILYQCKVDDLLGYSLVGNTAYNPATTYDTNNTALDSLGNVFRSLQDGNINNPLTDTSQWQLIWQKLGDLASLVNLNPATTTQLGFSYLLQQIVIENNASDPDHDVNFSSGVMNFDDGTGQAVATAMTKRLDSSWSAGTNQGGLDTGSISPDTWYYCFAIHNPTTSTTDFLFSASRFNPTLPSGYTKKKYRGAVLTDDISNIATGQYIYSGDTYSFTFDFPNFEGSYFFSTTHLNQTVSTPPRSIVNLQLFPNNLATSKLVYIYVDNPSIAPSTPSLSKHSIKVQEAVGQYIDRTSNFVSVKTNNLSQVRYVSSSNLSATFNITVYGFIEDIRF